MTLEKLKLHFGTVSHAVNCANRLGYNSITRHYIDRNEVLIKEHSEIFKNVVAKMAEDADCQVWLERVGHGKECSVIIHDGNIKE